MAYMRSKKLLESGLGSAPDDAMARAHSLIAVGRHAERSSYSFGNDIRPANPDLACMLGLPSWNW